MNPAIRCLHLIVQVGVAGQESDAVRARAVLRQGDLCRCRDLRMAQQPQVGVGRRQEHPPAVDHHVGTIDGLNGFEVRVDPSRLYVADAVSKLPDAPFDRIHAPASKMLRDEGAGRLAGPLHPGTVYITIGRAPDARRLPRGVG